MPSTGVGETLLAALQASVSVLLVISYGGLAAKLGILTPESTKAVSKVCVRMFLPALLVTKLGAELDAGSAGKYGIIVLWGLLAHFISFLIGILGHFVFKMPDWVTVAVMFNNTASYPLLLIGALQQTGILSSLLVNDETTADAIERANSYFLVFSTISNCLTFAVGPRLIDTEHAPEPNSDSDSESSQHDDTDDDDDDDDREPQANEGTGLLNGNHLAVPAFHNPFGQHNAFFPSSRKSSAVVPNGTSQSHYNKRRASFVPHKHWIKLSPRTKWWLVFLSDFLNAPLIGALVGAVIGLSPPLHRAFFNDTQSGGIFTAWLTASLQKIGTLFVPLPVVIAGTSLYSAYKKTKEKSSNDEPKGLPWVTVTYIMFVRFVLWPVAAIGFVYLLASKTSVLGDDPMLWFTMMLMPCGPPAMKLITLVQVSDSGDEEEGIIAKLLMISYVLSPVLSFAVVGSLRAAQAAV